MKDIKNRVAQSKLITIDLEDYYPQGNRIVFDIKDWLYEGLILKEQDFRATVNEYDWSQHKGDFIALGCSVDAIIPSWAFLLIASHITPFANSVVIGDLAALENAVFQDIITNMPIEQFKNKPIIIKGCSKKPIPETAYIQLISRLIPVTKSIMYGEACSTVPLYKVKNN